MPNNFVIIGPAHGGKSTLGGYILYKSDITRFQQELKNIEKTIVAESASGYDKSQALANLLDEARDERLPFLKPQNQEVITTSIYTHYHSVSIGGKNFAIIDTPGAQNRVYERTKGILNGDVAIFMIELSKLLNRENTTSLEQFLSPIFVWGRLGRAKETRIIAFSKMDEEEFDQSRFEVGRDLLREILRDQNISPVPISISVDNLFDHNIFQKSLQMSWYNGPTLIELLLQKAEHIPEKHKHGFFMHVDKLLDLKYDLVVRGKVLRGQLQQGDTIKLCPLIFQNKEHVTLEATAHTIRLVKSAEVRKSANAGEIIGVGIKDLRVAGRRCQKEDFDTIGSTCIVGQDTQLLLGSILRFSFTNIEQVENFDFMDTVRLIWFGKTLSATVVHKSEKEGTFKIDVELNKAGAAIPLNQEGLLMMSDFYIISSGENFITAKLEELGNVEWISVYLPESYISQIENTLEYFKNLPVKAESDRLVFYPEGGVKQIIAKIRFFFRRMESGEQPVEVLMKNIHIELKGQKGDQPSIPLHIS